MQTEALQAFEAERPRLLRLAYRMLGSHAEAEDMVQDAFLRLQRADDIDRPAAWLTRVVSRLCLDQMKLARARRETAGGVLERGERGRTERGRRRRIHGESARIESDAHTAD